MSIDQMMEFPYEAGHLIGDSYTLLERLGYGGQAVVWSAWDQSRERVVAIKFTLPETDDFLREASRLRREVDLVSSLHHPHILPVYDVGMTGNHAYLVMRYACGGSVQDMLVAGPIRAADALPLAAQMADALEHMHEQNIVHRDVKPRNVLLDSRSRAYLSDFGLARPLSDTTRAMHTGQGTAPYAPPEQHAKYNVTPASDIYSLGISLFEMLTGRLPWEGQVPLGIRQLRAGEELPDPREVNPALPAALAGALRRLTSAEPEDRPASALDAYRLVSEALLGAGGWQPEIVPAPHDDVLGAQDARYLLESALADWGWGASKFNMSLTHFALVNAFYSQAERFGLSLDERATQFMLSGALAYGRGLEDWAKRTASQAARLEVIEHTLAHEDEAAAARALGLLLLDRSAAPGTHSALDALIELATSARTPEVRKSAARVLSQAVASTQDWRAVGFTQAGDDKLADQALGDGAQSLQAARLIGQARSERAVQALVREQDGPNNARSTAALLEVREAAGSLPSSVPSELRFRISTRLGRRQLLEDRSTLLRAYLAAGLGSALGLGAQVYATYRLPSFLDSARILNSLGSGLLFGLIIGLGIFLSRVIVGRLRAVPTGARMALGVGLGALTINLGFAGYHALFLGVAPRGPMLTLGALLVALGFGAGALLPGSRWLRAMLAAMGVALALGLSWQFASRLASSPVLYYEVSQPAQTVLLIGLSSLLIGTVANVVELAPQGQEDGAPHHLGQG